MSKAAFFNGLRKVKMPWWKRLLRVFCILFFILVLVLTLYHAFHTSFFDLIIQALVIDIKFLFFLLMNIFIIGGASLILIVQWMDRDNINFRSRQKAYRSELISPDYYQNIRRVKIDQIVTSDIGESSRKLSLEHNLKDSTLVMLDDTVIVKKARETHISFKNGKLDGRFETFFSNGNLLAEINYKNGRLDGRCVIYYPNGAFHNEKNFKQGCLHGIFRAWDEDGALFFEIQYENDVQHGFDKIYRRNGAIEYEDTYVNGKIVRRKSFDDSGHFKYLQKYKVD